LYVPLARIGLGAHPSRVLVIAALAITNFSGNEISASAPEYAPDKRMVRAIHGSVVNNSVTFVPQLCCRKSLTNS